MIISEVDVFEIQQLVGSFIIDTVIEAEMTAQQAAIFTKRLDEFLTAYHALQLRVAFKED
uniref:Uncharacterized protein n=1 Tax=viral metagenome TaxID=1070528 RepID=A0A6M3LHY4_9ZZZZ